MSADADADADGTSAKATSTGLRSAAAGRGPLAMEAVGLCKDFRLGRGVTLHAVKNASLSLYQGAVVALVGESGSGKSTVARLLAGQERLTAGTITLDGQPVSIGNRRAFRQYKSSVQLVFQDPFASLNPVHTVRHHLQRPVRLHQGAGVDVSQQVAELMEQVRLTPAEQYLVKYPHELSGGQRQRVSFARALAARPKVLLADEPVSMLDVSIRLEMLNLLDDLRRRLALALLYITHDIASARYFADEVLVMYAGEIVERGPAEDVTQHPAHPYTQLLIASAPDPDNLGSLLRTGSGSSAARARGTGNGPRAVSAPATVDVQAALSGQPAMNAEVASVAEVAPAAESAADARAAVSGPAAIGCPFSTRCPLADDRCRRENPALRQLTAVRAAACWRLDVAAPELFTAQSRRGREPD
jgi:peptide/nickel transport system ATP-binding protein